MGRVLLHVINVAGGEAQSPANSRGHAMVQRFPYTGVSSSNVTL